MNNTQNFPFSKENYYFIFGGIIVLILGYLLMSGGASEDPNVFKGKYSLNAESFEKLTDQFLVDQSIIKKLKPLENKVFPSEEELKTAIMNQLGSDFEKNYYYVRAATQIDADIFSPRRITVAPIVVIFGYFIILFGILFKKKTPTTIDTNNTQLSD